MQIEPHFLLRHRGRGLRVILTGDHALFSNDIVKAHVNPH